MRGEVAGSKIAWVKIPCRCASVGTTLNRVMPVRSRVPCQSAKKNVLLRLNRPAERRAVLIAAELRLRARLREQVPRVQRFVAEELEQAAVEFVAAGFADHHDRAAVRPAILGRVGVDVELEFGHAVDDRVVDHLPRLRLQHADAVVDVFVGARPAAVDARQELAVRAARRPATASPAE